MRVSDFTYILPDERIAKHPPAKRGQSRLLVLNKTSGEIDHRNYQDFAEYVNAGDVVVLNDTKVIAWPKLKWPAARASVARRPSYARH